MMQWLRQSPEIKIRQPGCPQEKWKVPFDFSMHAKQKSQWKEREKVTTSACVFTLFLSLADRLSLSTLSWE